MFTKVGCLWVAFSRVYVLDKTLSLHLLSAAAVPPCSYLSVMDILESFDSLLKMR